MLEHRLVSALGPGMQVLQEPSRRLLGPSKMLLEQGLRPQVPSMSLQEQNRKPQEQNRKLVEKSRKHSVHHTMELGQPRHSWAFLQVLCSWALGHHRSV